MSGLTVAVLGPADAGVTGVAGRLDAASGPEVRVLAHVPPEVRPDVALLTLDPACPIRPDDVAVGRGVAGRVPLVVVHPVDPRHPDPETTREHSARRLAAAGLPEPLLLAPHDRDDDPGGVSTVGADPGAAVDTAGLLEHLRRAATGPTTPTTASDPGVVVDPAATGTAPAEVLDWLTARRTEAITTRSAALRQDVQVLRMELTGELHRCVREAGADARDRIGRADARAVADLARRIGDAVDDRVAAVFADCDDAIDLLLTRHLGPGHPDVHPATVPAGGIGPSAPPRHRTEEGLTLAMGAAGGTGVGRMVLTPLADSAEVGALVVPLAIAVGLGLGAATVRIRRTQALRTHVLASVTERLAGLRSEAEQSLATRLLAAESVVADGFAHDPGPRVTDLDRRIRALRRALPPRPSPSPAPAGGAAWTTA